MPQLTLDFSDDDMTVARLTAKAVEHGFSPEEWVHRLIAHDLADYQLKPLAKGFELANLAQLLAAAGVTKPRQ